jgi:hypothetical protein
MAYLPVPPLDAGSPAGAEALRALLADLAGRKEFAALAPPPGGSEPRLTLPGLRLSGAQLFVRGFENPDTPYPRLLVSWQTGTGKSIVGIGIGQEFIRQYRLRAALGDSRHPSVFVISFTHRETFQEDMLRYPEFGFVSAAEVEDLRRLRAAAGAGGGASPEARQLSGLLGVLRRRITDRARGGYYQFYGYKEFANRLFMVTRAGIGRGFDATALYGRGAPADFGARLAEAVRRGDVGINGDLLEELRGGLLIADEIHNVYNVQEPNNYGIAIQYVLDALGAEAPRAVFMSATPMTGSAAEIVDLLNLLVPRAALPSELPLRRADFFVRAAAPPAPGAVEGDGDEEGEGSSSFVVSQLREGAAEQIAHLAAGRVSFLLDSDVGSYPRRIFVGDEVPGIPYLRLTPCPMTPFHERTLAREQGEAPPLGPAPKGLAANAYTLYDMAFPNPDEPPGSEADPASEAVGLYLSGETPARLAQASPEWRAAEGVIVERGVEAGVAAGTYVFTGPFLGLERLGHLSAKAARVVAETIAAIRAGPGKVMIYHHRVRMSGVLLYQEALRMNGLADETSAPTDATLCSVCGVPRGEHRSEGHAYQPARFVVAHSDIDRAAMLRSIARYNAPANREGYSFRVLVGSRVVREGLHFRGVRHQFVASLPTDYPTLVQVFGRVVRKDSHAELPEDQRDVRIRVFVSTRADGRPSPELQRYTDKGREYLVIQEVERALRVWAVDGFANYGRIRAALHAGPDGALRPSLDSLPYAPAVGPEARAPPAAARTATFEAYGHGEREVAAIAAVCRALFRAQPVWTYEDLWAAVRGGAVRGAGRDPAYYAEDNYAAALLSLDRPAGDPPTVVTRAGRFFVAALAAPGGGAALDVETFLRDFPAGSAGSAGPAVPQRRLGFRVADYLREARSGQNFAVHLREFEEAFLRPGAPPLELALVGYGAPFHYALLRRLVARGGGPRVTADDERVADLYRRFRIAVTLADASAPAAARAFRGARPGAPNSLVGYVTPEAVSLRDQEGQWYSAPHADFGIGRRHRENDIVVGFVASLGPAGAPGTRPAGEDFAAASVAARFKVRPPAGRLRAGRAGRGDVRSLARGAVCETRPREELGSYVRRLQDALGRGGRGGGGYAPREPLGRGAPAGDLCRALQLCLLALEEGARAGPAGMANGLRYLYLFNDAPPSVSALMGQATPAREEG